MSANNFDTLMDRLYLPEHPHLGSGPLPVEPYISAEYFQREKETVFQDAWLLVCHESELPKTGDYIIKDAAIFRSSVLIVRAADGLRAFHNVCQHRGNKIICDSVVGHASALFCKFHGWTYALDGRLRGVPEQDRFPTLDKRERGLKPITMQQWNGFVFINAREHPAKTLLEYLGGLGEALKDYPFQQMRPLGHYSATIRANWKVGINAFQEAYHVPTVHALSAPTLFVSRLAHFRFHGDHRSMTLPISPGFKPRPVEILSSGLTSGMSQNAVDPTKVERFPGTNPFNMSNYSFDINIVFPSSFIDVGEGYYFTYEFWPIEVNKTLFIMKAYAMPPKTWSQRVGQELSIIFLREGVAEDLSTLESTQEGLESGALESMVLSDQEIAIRHQHEIIDRYVREGAGAGRESVKPIDRGTT